MPTDPHLAPPGNWQNGQNLESGQNGPAKHKEHRKECGRDRKQKYITNTDQLGLANMFPAVSSAKQYKLILYV